MNVCLIDVDSKIPNLALMKASTWHKQRGDTVKLGYDPLFDHPDLCYVVWRMDGNAVRHVADLDDFWCGQEVVRLLDDNIMADEDEFVADCKQLHDAGVKVIWEALDIRLVNDRTASALASVKTAKSIHFAWDSKAQEPFIEGGIETLKRHGIKPWRLMFYVLVGHSTTPEYDMHRIMTLHGLGANPFVMPYYDNGKKSEYAKHLARWCNNKFVFKSTDFDHYEPWVKCKEMGVQA